jgi:murein DD-endopeptidase MepM/ murein hydrolase activator NlpD
MTCYSVRRLLSSSREWTDQERTGAEEHLAKCPTCRFVAREYELMDRRLRRLPYPAMVAALPSAVQAWQLIKEQSKKAQPRALPRRVAQGVGLLAAVAVIAVVALLAKGRDSAPLTGSGFAATASTRVAALTVKNPQEPEATLFTWPVAGTLTQTFWPGHQAVDLANLSGTSVYAAGDGVVIKVGVDAEDGNFVLLDHGDGYETFYSHLLRIIVEKDWLVVKGQKIGELGATGKATGPHLHFEIRKDGERLNPLELVPQEERAEKLHSSSLPETDPAPAKPDGGGFSWPTDGQVSQTYWMGHRALDIANWGGAPVYATRDGVVILSAEDEGQYGIHLLLDHGDGYTSFYSHLSSVDVKVDEAVEEGQKIGSVGSTGLATGPHLHFEIRKGGEPVNPLPLMVEGGPYLLEGEVPGSVRVYGVQAHMIDQNPRPIAQAVQDLGFGWIKQQVQWELFEPTNDAFEWERLDQLVVEAEDTGVEILWSVVNAPDWSRSEQDLDVAGPPDDPQELADFLEAVAARYCGSSLRAIEIWDEQNLHYKWGGMTIDPEAYMDLLRPAYIGIKAECPDMLVISGGLTPTGAPSPKAMDDVRYLEGMYRHGLKDYSDAIGAHLPTFNLPPDADIESYEDPTAHFRGPFQWRHRSWSFRATAEAYRLAMERFGDGDSPIWVTEFGWAVGDNPPKSWAYAADNTYSEQAEYTLRAFDMAREWGWVEAMFLWNLNFSSVDPDSPKAMWSIVGPDWERWETFKALEELHK